MRKLIGPAIILYLGWQIFRAIKRENTQTANIQNAPGRVVSIDTTPKVTTNSAPPTFGPPIPLIVPKLVD